MKKLELSIFKRLALSIIGIIIIPIIVFISKEVLNRSENELAEKRKETIRNMNSISQKLVDTYTKLEAIGLIISKDIDFLDFLTSEKEHNPVEYIVFQREDLKNYEKILSISRDISQFKIYVDNDKLLEIYPYIKNKLPENRFLKNEAKLTIKGGKPFLYYFKEIYFYPKKLYVEMEVDLSEIFYDKLDSYYFVNEDRIINPSSKDTTKIEENLKSIVLNKTTKIKAVKIKDELYILQKLPFTEVKLLNILYQKGFIDLRYLGYLVLLGIIILVFIYYIAYFISKKIFKQLDFIFGAVEEIKKGNLKITFPNKFEHIEFVELSNQLISMGENIESLINENRENQKLVNDFQMKALQSQINSHFLQNSLEGIKMMAYINKDYEVSNALLSLGKILRYGMDWKNPIVNLSDEITYLQEYISVFSIRTENEIFFRVYIDNELKDMRIPKMILQPLVENSIIHGIIPKDVLGLIQIRIYKRSGELVFEILDNGLGFSDIDGNYSGIGIYNVQKRLELFFNKKVSFDIKSIEHKFSRIKICIESCGDYEKNINC